MKKEIHPKYYNKAKVICACGNNFETGSIMEELKVELCSMCHPFYTGKQKLVDTARRVEKFEAKKEAQKKISKVRKGKKVKRAALAKKKAKKEVKMKADNDVKVVSKKKSIRQAPSKKAGKQDRVGKK